MLFHVAVDYTEMEIGDIGLFWNQWQTEQLHAVNKESNEIEFVLKQATHIPYLLQVQKE